MINGMPAWRLIRIYILLFLVSSVHSAPAAGNQLQDRLFDAIKWGDTNRVKKLVSEGADVNTRDSEGLTPLYWACAAGREQVAQFLPAQGSDVNGRALFGTTPLMAASGRGHTDIVRLLLQKGADLNAKNDNGRSALFTAAVRGQREVVELLLEKGADPHISTGRGGTPLMGASNYGRAGTVRLLLDRGVDVNAKTDDGMTALMIASYRNRERVVKLLLERGADVNHRDKNGRTALMLASTTGCPDLVRLLLAKGADASLKNSEGDTALTIASRRGHADVVKTIAAAAGAGTAKKDGTNDSGSASPSQKAAGISGASLPSNVVVAERGVKVAQLIGEYDRERRQPTTNRTLSSCKLFGTDLGVSFRHKGRTYLLFGDTIGIRGGDPIAYATDTKPEDGLDLTFVQDKAGVYSPVKIPGISQGGFEVPMEGVSVNGRMYIYHTTDHSRKVTMGRSVVAVSSDDGKTFAYIYDLSTRHFINVSIVETDLAAWDGFPESTGTGLVIFGSGAFRKSDARLAFQPAAEIESPRGIRYFAGLDGTSRPIWSTLEEDARPLFNQPCVGELSVTYNRFIKKWIMLYNCAGKPKGINLRTADLPWGPWSEPRVIFEAAEDRGFCRFIHFGWKSGKCDALHDPGREDHSGDSYGPYQLEHLAVGGESHTTLYFTLSTWNPYTVVLMKTTLRKTTGEHPPTK